MSKQSLAMFAPLTKLDHSRQLVFGVLAESAPDRAGEVMDWETGKQAVLDWSNGFKKTTGVPGQGKSAGNLRVMHTKKAAGKFVSVLPNDHTKQIEVCAHVVDPDEWAKCVAGVYTGFSMGGDYAKKWPGKDGTVRYTPLVAEGSLADNPCMYGSTFTALKTDGSLELTKMVGADALEKDAGAVSAAATAAIASIKTILTEMGQMDAESEAINVHDVAEALQSILFVKQDADMQVATTPDAPGADAAPAAPEAPSTEELAAAIEAGDLEKLTPLLEKVTRLRALQKIGLWAPSMKKQSVGEMVTEAMMDKEMNTEAVAAEMGDETDAAAVAAIAKGETTPSTTQVTEMASALSLDADALEAEVDRSDEGEGDDAPPADPDADPDPDADEDDEAEKAAKLGVLIKGQIGEIDLAAPLAKALGESQTVQTALAKVVKTTVQEAVKTGLAEVTEGLEKMEQRVQTVEGAPAAVGRAVTAVAKSLGSDPQKPGGDLTVEQLEKAVDTLEKEGGLTGDALKQARMGLATLAVPRV